MTEPASPKWIGWLVRRLLPGAYGAEFLADLDEAFRGRTVDNGGSKLRATLWCLGQVARPDTMRLAVQLRTRARKQTTTERGRARRTKGPGFVGFLEGLGDDLRSAVRSLVRSPAHTLLACGTLALGIGATTAIFSAVDSVLLRPFPYVASERMYAFSRPIGRVMYPPTPEQVAVWSEQEDVFESVFRLRTERLTITGTGPAERVLLGLTEAQTLSVLGVQPLLGRAFLPEEARGEGTRVVLLANHVWRSRFGSDPGVLGRSVSLDGDPWEVIGVMPPRAPFPYSFQTNVDFWAPLPENRVEQSAVVAIAREGVTGEDVQARLDLIRERAVEQGETGDRWQATAYSVADRVGAFVAEPLRILMAAVVLVLMIAFVNVANLLLGRATLRRTETSVRSAIGASRARLVRQLLVEALVLGAVGTGLGLIVAYGSVEAVRAFRPTELAVMDQIRINGRVLGLAACVGVVGAMLFGSVPAWQGTRAASLAALRTSASLERGGVAARRFRWLLVCGEVALSFALLVGSVMALRTLFELQQRNLAFAADEVVLLAVSLPSWEYEDRALLEETQQRFQYLIERQSGVAEVSQPRQLPIIGGSIRNVTPQVEGLEPREEREILLTHAVDANFHRVLGVPILAGRAFTEAEVRDSARVAILAQRTAQQLFGNASPLGRRFRYGPAAEWYTVVGVAAEIDPNGRDVTYRELQVYHPGRSRGGAFVIRVSPGSDPDAVLDRIRQALRTEAPDVLIPVATTARGLMWERAARERFTTALLATFGLLAFVLAIVGLYGVVSSLVGQRTREIGIRVSLGADRGDVRRLVLGEGAGATALGIVAGAVLAWAGLQILSSQIFGLNSGGMAGSYGMAAALLSLASLAACWVPAQRAASLDPVRAMRED